MKKINVKDMSWERDFLKICKDGYKVYFSTAEKNRSFNRHTKEGLIELNKLKTEFNLDEIIYIRQVHSDTVFEYTSNLDVSEFKENEGDAIITSVKNIGIGIFTADCVPILLVDKRKKVIGAVHSGWRGTYNSITLKTISKMVQDYGSNASDIDIFIGPHIKECCYEVSEELKQKFIEKKDIDQNVLFNGRNLNMDACIFKDLMDSDIEEKNINIIDSCTFCSSDVALHSFRRSNGEYGRLFSFIVLD